MSSSLAELSTGELAARLIRVDTQNPPGREADLLDQLAPELAEEGLEVERYALDPDRPNLLVRLPGAGTVPPLLLHGHVDVVPVAGQRWSADPFAAELRDGVLWGRGALDMKGGVAMLICSLLRAARHPQRPPGDVLLALLSDEEAGGTYGARFLVEQHAQLFAGVRHAIGEFGGFSFTFAGKRLYPIQVQEKQRCIVRLTARGGAAHGALGSHDSAIAALARTINRITKTPLPVHVTDTARASIEAIAEVIGSPSGPLVRNLLHPRRGRLLLRALGDRVGSISPMLQDVATVTMVNAGAQVNVVPETAEAHLDCRILPGREPDDLLADLRPMLGRSVTASVELFERNEDRVDWSLYERLADLLRAADPDGHPVPMLLPAVTDGRHFARLGIQHYGFLPLRLPPELPFSRLLHAADERVPVSALQFGTEILSQLLLLDRPTPGATGLPLTA
jgi:acetylornithine deacetylase/succinyl-diaminopimelate desuccinylase-like protein